VLQKDQVSGRPWLIGVTAALAIAFTMARAARAAPAPGHMMLRCVTEKVVITEGPQGQSSKQSKEILTFRVDNTTKTLKFPDNTPLAIKRFDRSWITAEHGGIIYDFDRRNHMVSYAGSTAKGAIISTVVGSGGCHVAPMRSHNGE
jgi:hypothetical protein